ncbi:hypothetical protein B0T10DRAFT_465860 [Thelonectria olida]|uniref:Uncharacterized protein n=1 Tax=Thelonectria olida TaxID=1576542 RepID=A0A9P9AJJ0_9HYPO|nr:hypothetical protein B0T10DRAFT_465860 [Thelonectria olida]
MWPGSRGVVVNPQLALMEWSVFDMDPYRKHAEVWTRVVKEDRWFEQAMCHGSNPFLVGPDLGESSDPSYLALVTPEPPTGVFELDCGDILHNLQVDEAHDYNEDTGDVTLNDGRTTLNIWQPKHRGSLSRVVDLQARLTRTGPNEKKTTAALSLRSPTVDILRAAISQHVGPNGDLVIWEFVDHTIASSSFRCNTTSQVFHRRLNLGVRGVGKVGLTCKINTNRVAHWSGSVSCDDICVHASYQSRECNFYASIPL